MTDNYWKGKIDLHMHTRVSDGSDAPEEILAKVKEKGITLFSVTDHDAIKGFKIIPGLLGEGDPFFIAGVEFSCKDEEGKYHILGYKYDPEGESINNVVEKGHEYRMKKVGLRLDYLKDTFGFTFDDKDVEELMALDNPGKPHIGNMMVKYGYAESKEKAIKDYINGVRFKSEYVRPEEAIEGILKSGGIPILAHPTFGDGDQIVMGEDMDHRIRKLMDFGLKGLEVFYSGFTGKIRDELLGFAEKYDLYVTAGSDYHGTNKMVILGDTGLEENDDYPKGLNRFLREVI